MAVFLYNAKYGRGSMVVEKLLSGPHFDYSSGRDGLITVYIAYKLKTDKFQHAFLSVI